MKRKLALLLSMAMTASAFSGMTVNAEEEITLTIMSCLQTEDEAELEAAMADAYMEANPNIKKEIPVTFPGISFLNISLLFGISIMLYLTYDKSPTRRNTRFSPSQAIP